MAKLTQALLSCASSGSFCSYMVWSGAIIMESGQREVQWVSKSYTYAYIQFAVISCYFIMIKVKIYTICLGFVLNKKFLKVKK